MFYRIGLACITPYRLLLVCKALTTQIFLIRVRDKNILRTFQSGKNGRKVIFKIFTDFLLTMSGGKYRKYWPGVKMEGEIDKSVFNFTRMFFGCITQNLYCYLFASIFAAFFLQSS